MVRLVRCLVAVLFGLGGTDVGTRVMPGVAVKPGTGTGTFAPFENPPARFSRNLDRPPFAGEAAEIDMMAGRLNKLPVSWFYKTTLELAGEHRLRLRTRGCAGTGDTALLVTFSDGAKSFTAFDDDGNQGDGNGHCSLIELGSRSDLTKYTIYVLSMKRATSLATLESSRAVGGPVWNTITTDHFGGTLVRVGPLRKGDFVKVETASDGKGNDPTRMVLFEPPALGASLVEREAIFNDEQSSSDRDPRGNKNFKSPFSLKGKIRPKSWSRIGELSGYRSARSAKFRGVLASWVN